MRTARSLPYGGEGSVQRGVGVSAKGGLCPVRGVSVRETPPPMNRMTDSCKNTTFSQLRLRAVKICTTLHHYKWNTSQENVAPPLTEDLNMKILPREL